jgi:hypothetical protein
MCWNLINSLPPPRGSGTEEERKRANEHDVTHQQQRLMVERLRQERYYPPGVSIIFFNKLRFCILFCQVWLLSLWRLIIERPPLALHTTTRSFTPAHRVHFSGFYGSENKQQLFPYVPLNEWFSLLKLIVVTV